MARVVHASTALLKKRRGFTESRSSVGRIMLLAPFRRRLWMECSIPALPMVIPGKLLFFLPKCAELNRGRPLGQERRRYACALLAHSTLLVAEQRSHS